jgi:molybdopterin synthase sulfur carrier subunit
MKLQVLFFASLKEHLGKSEMQLELASQPSVASLWQSLRAGKDALPEQILFAVNHRYVHADYQLRDGDVVAFFPPVTGG